MFTLLALYLGFKTQFLTYITPYINSQFYWMPLHNVGLNPWPLSLYWATISIEMQCRVEPMTSWSLLGNRTNWATSIRTSFSLSLFHFSNLYSLVLILFPTCYITFPIQPHFLFLFIFSPSCLLSSSCIPHHSSSITSSFASMSRSNWYAPISHHDFTSSLHTYIHCLWISTHPPITT